MDTQYTRIAYSILWAVVLFMGTSCSNGPAPDQTAPALVLPTTSNIPPTATLIPAPMETPIPTPTATEERSLKPEICSPLAVQPLEKISEIITQPFIMPRVMEDGTYKDDGHHGVDLGYYTRDGKLFTGTPVLSAMDGKVAAIIHDRPPYGNMLIVETPFERIPPTLVESQGITPGSSLFILYAHLQNLQPLEIGQSVTCGQQLAETGLTGFTGGPHLHFETRWGPAGTTFNGMAYYKADTTDEERANYEAWRMSGVFHLFDAMELLTIQP
jgi:murein DD-endopeptidase MepM/ murein hydrolase activator NlpD